MADASKLSNDQLMQIAFGGSASVSAPPFEVEARSFLDAPSPVARAGRGGMDILQGIKQKFLNWTDPGAAAQYTERVNRELEQYSGGLGNQGFDWWRLGGTVAAGAPTLMLPGGASVAPRLLSGGAAGGLLGYAGFSPDNDPTKTGLMTGAGMAAGGLLNAAIPPVMNLGMQGLQAVGNKLSDLVRQSASSIFAPNAQVVNSLRVTLQNRGVDWDRLSQEAQKSLVAEAKEQMRVTGALDAEQLARMADIETIAGPGSATLAQVTRDPSRWSIERNLQRTEVNLPDVRTGSQETITGRLQQQDQALKTFATRVGDSVYGEPLYGGVSAAGPAQTSLQAGQRAINAVQGLDEKTGKVVQDLYKKYSDFGMGKSAVPETRLTAALTKVIDEIGLENVPPAVVTRLKEFGFLGGERARTLTIQEADLFNRLLNANRPQAGGGVAAVGMLQRALNESLLDVVPTAKQGAEALLAARSAAAKMFEARREGRGVERAIDNVAPDKFMEQNVLGGSVRDLQALKEQIARSPEPSAWNDLRAQAWQWIYDSATQGGRSQFSGATLDTTLRRIGEERLRVLFTPAELASINTLRRGSLSMTFAPPFSAVNYSNTAPALISQALRLGNRVPLMNVITQPIAHEAENAAAQAALREALSGRGAAEAIRAARQAQVRQGLLGSFSGTGVGPLSGLLPSAGAGQFR